MVILKQEQPTRSPFAPACSLSLYHSKTLVSLILSQVYHISLFWFDLRVFSITDLEFFSFHSVSSSHAFFGLRRPLLFWCLPLCLPKNIPPAPLEETRILRVLWYLSSNFSILITFDISYERLLIKYMLKEYSRFQFSCLLSNTSSFFIFHFF